MLQWDPASGNMIDEYTGQPPSMMPPQTLPDDPVPPTPQLSQPIAPQQQTMAPPPPPTAPRPDYSNLPLPALLPSENDPKVKQAIGQGYDQLTEGGMTLGNALALPLTAPLGILEELRGLVGMNTIGGWAEKADQRYDNPDLNETRAFGKRVAEEPAAGDRYSGIGSKFMGLVTGESQRRAMAGKVLTRQILEYNARRKANLEEHKDVMSLQQGQQGLELGELTRQQKQFGIDTQAQKFLDSLATSAASRNASAASAASKWYDLSQKQGKAGRRQALTNQLMLNPALVDDWNALVAAAGGDLDVASEALSAVKGYRTRPDALTGMTTGETTQANLAGVNADTARLAGDLGTQDTRNYTEGRDELTAQREYEERTAKLAEARRVSEEAQAVALGKESRGDIADLYGKRQVGISGDLFGDSRAEKLGALGGEQARVIEMMQNRQIDDPSALAIAGGDEAKLAEMMTSGTLDPTLYNAAKDARFLTGMPGLDAPAVMPSAAPPPLAPLVPRPEATPRPMEALPAMQARAFREAEMQKLGLGGPRPTPMAQPTRATAGPLRTEDERAKNQTLVNAERARFDAVWKEKRVPLGKPVGGEAYKKAFEEHIRRIPGLSIEALSPEPVR